MDDDADDFIDDERDELGRPPPQAPAAPCGGAPRPAASRGWFGLQPRHLSARSVLGLLHPQHSPDDAPAERRPPPLRLAPAAAGGGGGCTRFGFTIIIIDGGDAEGVDLAARLAPALAGLRGIVQYAKQQRQRGAWWVYATLLAANRRALLARGRSERDLERQQQRAKKKKPVRLRRRRLFLTVEELRARLAACPGVRLLGDNILGAGGDTPSARSADHFVRRLRRVPGHAQFTVGTAAGGGEQQ